MAKLDIIELKEYQDTIRAISNLKEDQIDRRKELEDKAERLQQIIKVKRDELLSKSTEELIEINKAMEAKKMTEENKPVRKLIKTQVAEIEEKAYEALKGLSTDNKVLVSLTQKILERFRTEKKANKGGSKNVEESKPEEKTE